jgi:serine/threonine protein kinase
MDDEQCLTDAELAALALGTLADGEIHRAVEHLEKCPRCESRAAAIDGMTDPLIDGLRSSEQSVGSAVGPGTILGEYRIEEEVGSGGMGRVYRATHTRMKRIVALKVISPRAIGSTGAFQRFAREVEAAAKLVHPNIALAFDAGEQQGVHYLILEYIDGTDLRRLLKQRGPLPPAEAAEYILQAAKGLAYAHGQGVIHRDIKPANLMLDARGTVKVLDLGLSRSREGEAPDQPGAGEKIVRYSLEVTQDGAVMGTLGYLAPEQAENAHAADHRADIYSLGCTFYRLLTGRTPSAVGTWYQSAETSRTGSSSAIPPALQAICGKMLAPFVVDRYQTMDEVVAALSASLGRGEPPAQKKREHRGRRIAIAVSFALIALLTAAAIATYLRYASSRPTRALASAVSVAPDDDPWRTITVPASLKQARLRQKQYAVEHNLRVKVVNHIGMELALIPPGDFHMSPDRLVRITHPFYASTCEVTVEQFRAFADQTGYRTSAEKAGESLVEEGDPPRMMSRAGASWRSTGFDEQADDMPVIHVSHDDAVAFCQWLSQLEHERYRLPTEAEWEWAARGGSSGNYIWGDDLRLLEQFAHTKETSQGHPHRVAQVIQNGWGLYDTVGNVNEWVADLYRMSLPAGTYEDPTGPTTGVTYVLRGGSYREEIRPLAKLRGNADAPTSHIGFGFRVVRDIQPSTQP